MSFSDFRGIAPGAQSKKAERLFRAAVSAFCCLTRPSRRDIAQLEDLALPLFDWVSLESRRYVAAALSECDSAPKALVKRLCDETVDVAAPLLIRSKALGDVDLIALIGRHGAGHARAIARRPGLNPTIADLVQAIDRKVVRLRPAAVETGAAEAVAPPAGNVASEPASDSPVESARSALRSMMRGDDTTSINAFNAPASYARLRDTALSGNAALFQTALADALDLEFAVARMVMLDLFSFSLVAALRALDLTEDQAFLIAAAIRPAEFSSPEAIRLFLERFRLLEREAVRERVGGWQAVPAFPASAEAQPKRRAGV